MKKRTLSLLIVITIILVITASFYLSQNYYVVRPGKAIDLKDFVSIENSNEGSEGAFFLVTVLQQRATIPLFIYGLVSPSVDILPRNRVIPPEMDPQEYRELTRLWMEESQILAKVLALRKAGYNVPIESDGVVVVEVLNDSPAYNILKKDDIIKEVDDKKVYLTEELIEIVQNREPGDNVKLTIQRGDRISEKNIETTTHTENETKAALRVFVRTLNWEPQIPIDIEINTGGITGPSAGMMFVLEILNQLTPEDITKGQKIAGTGTVNIREEVGSIGGVKQKVVAAEKAGADIFLVPENNFLDAQRASRTIQVISIKELEEAINILEITAKPSTEGLNFYRGRPKILTCYAK